jgi:hypothetical protein
VAGASPYHAVVRDAQGNVVGDAALSVTYGHLDGRPSTPVASFAGAVPAAAGQRVDVTYSGAVAATRTRSAHPPQVTVLAPRRGTIGRGRTVLVRWRARDADGDPLTATVDYSTDAGRHWRSVFMGVSHGKAALSSHYFTGAGRARVRVTVNDGFDQATAVSGALRAVGSPPTVTILSPEPSALFQSDASVYLHGSAFDDAFNRLTGSRLRWFAGTRLVGRGESATATDLPAGRVRVRLVARDGRRRTGSASIVLRIKPARPLFRELSAPARVPRGARRVALRVETNVSAILRAGGRSFKVGPRMKSVSVPIRPGSGPLQVVLKLTAHGRSATRTLVLAR